MVMITAEEGLAALVDTLQVEVFSDGERRLSGSEGLIDGAPIRESGSPVAIPLLPSEGDATRTYELTAELFDADGTSLGTQAIAGDYVENELREVWLVFEDSCRDELCPDGFRCYQGQCAEDCVEPVELGVVDPSAPVATGPVACSTPCEQTACTGDPDNQNVLRCVDGYGVVEQECGLGCDLGGSEACRELVPSNVGTFDWEPGLRDLVVGEDGVVEMVFNTEDGSIIADPGTAAETEIRAPIEGIDNGIAFELIELGSTTIEGGGPGPDEVNVRYGRFALGGLTIRAGASLRGVGTASLVLIVDRKVNVFGTLSVAATDDDPGPGGFRGGEGSGESASPGDGPGGGGPGKQEELCNLAAEGSSGGGGGSYGGAGGIGGAGGAGCVGLIFPGTAGFVYEAVGLSPLIGGSGGGQGGPNENVHGGHGGGAVQVSTNGRIRIGRNGLINAGGGGGRGVPVLPGLGVGGSGAGSGVAVLIEAGSLMFTAGEEPFARIGAPGGEGGGGGGFDDVTSDRDGLHGHPYQVPALSGNAAIPDGKGGAGSEHNGWAAPGNLSFISGGGGGGGGGRVHINTVNPDRAELEPFVTPRNEAAFTVSDLP